MLKKSGKIAALLVITIMVMGGLFGAALGQVQGTSKVSISFNILGNGVSPASGVKVELESSNGVVLASATSNPNVGFSVYPGSYIIYIPSQYVSSSSIVYDSTHATISVKDNGTVYVGSSVLKSINVGYSEASSYVYITVKGIAATQVTSIYLTLPNGLEMPATKVNSSNPNSGYAVTSIAGPQILTIAYNSTSKAFYSESLNISAGKANNSVIANVSSLDNVQGTVTSSSGSFVNKVEVSIYQGGVLLGADEFTNGYYYLSLAPGTYSLIISSPGYLPYTTTVTTGSKALFQTVSLTPSTVEQTEMISFGSSFQNVTISGGITLTNATTLPFLPYSNAGSLYQQMQLNGLSSNELWGILNVTVPYSTANTVLYNNYSYNSTGIHTTFSASAGTYEFTYTATYYQSKVKVQSYSSIRVYLNKNDNNTTALTYITQLSIPSPYQRANIVNSNVATVSGFSGTITITNSSMNGFLTINIAPQAKPILKMSQIVTTWNGYFESTISSNTSSNFTVLVPVGKTVNINASNIPYDTVLGMDNYQSMNFTWKIGNSIMYGYNISYNFTSGSHAVSLAVTSSGGVTNQTNFTIIGDSLNPQFNLRVIQNGQIKLNATTSSSASYVLYVNQIQTVYFNSINSKDLLPNGQSTGVPISVNWVIAGSSETGTNVSYSFPTPTFNSIVEHAYATIMNGVGNSFNVSIIIHVNDTTPPVVIFQITNVTSGKVITSSLQGQNVTLNGSKSIAPNGGHIVSYVWYFSFQNGTVAKPNVDYKVYSASSNNSTLRVAFLQYGVFQIKLKLTDQSNNTNSNIQSLSVSAVGPEVEIMNITYPKTYVEGSSSVLKLVLKNVGLQTASSYYVSIKIGGKVVKNQTFANLSSNQSINASVTFVPPSSGSFSMIVTVHAVNQPTFFNTNTSVTKAVSVAQAAWKLPALVGGIVVAIGVLSFIYYDVTVRRKRPKEAKQPKKQLKV
ncbi:MAG: carboxypeptidase-like regulatory domain-containing protein [Thermoplasmatales archaeon]